MEKYHSDTHRRDESYEEEPDAIKTLRHCPPVGKLVLDNLARGYPADKDTGKERSEGQEDIRCEEVAEVEEALAKDRDINSPT